MIIDENIVNAILRQWQAKDVMYSLKEFAASDPRLAQFLPLFTSTTVGLAVPSFVEEYGEGKKIDMVGTISNEFITDRITDAGYTSITLDKNGILKLNFNVGAKLVLESEPGDWIEARDMYATL